MRRRLQINKIYRHFKHGDEYIPLGHTIDNYNRSKAVKFVGLAELEEHRGKMYRVFNVEDDSYIAISSDGDIMLSSGYVYYQAQYGEKLCYLRKISTFLSKTDKIKYPEAKQEYRFECIEGE